MTSTKNSSGLLMASFVLVLLPLVTAAEPISPASAGNLHAKGPYTLVGSDHLLIDHDPVDTSGNITAIVEIPTGTNAKWEVDEKTGHLEWEIKDGKPRVVAYLGYPANYGMIPRTLLPENLGGDGDAIDVLVLGPSLPKGTIVSARLIGVLKMLDDGEQDDKLLAVPLSGSPMSEVTTLSQLDRDFPGVTQIIEIWFNNYKGKGKIQTLGFAGPSEAREILSAAVSAFDEAHLASHP